MTARVNLKISQGSTFRYALQWQTSQKEYLTVNSCTNSAPLQITVTGMLPPLDWLVTPVGVGGMTELNDQSMRVTEISGQTLTFGDVNSTRYKTYTSGGVLEYYKPVPLTGYRARMKLVGGAGVELANLTTENGGIEIDSNKYLIVIKLTNEQTSGLNFTVAKYDLELESPGLEVTRLIEGMAYLSREVTR